MTPISPLNSSNLKKQFLLALLKIFLITVGFIVVTVFTLNWMLPNLLQPSKKAYSGKVVSQNSSPVSYLYDCVQTNVADMCSHGMGYLTAVRFGKSKDILVYTQNAVPVGTQVYARKVGKRFSYINIYGAGKTDKPQYAWN